MLKDYLMTLMLKEINLVIQLEERNNKLVKMIDAIGDLKLGDYQDNSIDTFGDAYEYLDDYVCF
jgi:type I restriction enzyme M protein